VKLALVVACADNDVIGREGGLPWHLPDDLRHFKALTTGHAVIMGRRTFEEVGRPLPERRNLVVTSRHLDVPGIETFPSFEAALAACADEDEVFAIGGEGVFRAALPRADRIHLTRVHARPEGDARFPEVDWSGWELVDSERREADARHAHARTFERWERIPEAAPPERADGAPGTAG
jgi:dihydrofolate reductase